MARQVSTLQDNINTARSDDVQSYAFWLGGTDTTNAALAQYDLLRNRVMANSGGDMKCRARQQ